MHEIPQQTGRVTELIYTYHTIALAAGFILDLIFGDPRWLYHPVCLIGKLISSFEKGIRKVFPKTEKGELAGGLVEVILICVITLLVPAFVLYFLYIHLPALGVLLETFWCYQLLATRSLRDESMKVYDALKKGTIEDARHAVSMIVGRDTAELTEEGVTKAAVETVAENTSDGVIAPMIYMAIGGVPLMFLYKGINTMDSMLGYKNDKYLYFGRCAAKLDDAANVLPATRATEDLGRATSTICKCLKARVLLYAASPLWNGSFFKPDWQNENYETPDYGKELVSNSYDREKWNRALTACQEALTAAKAAGHDLFDIDTANKKAERDGVELPFIPGKEEDTPENEEFKERVRMFQYLITANEGDNNKEIIWGQRIDSDVNNGGEATDSRLPNRVVKKSDGSWAGGWAGLAPTLYAVQHFYTENGELPEQDSDFYPKSEWYTRFYEGTSSPELATNGLDSEDVKNDIIKLNAKREARFYAWIAFDGCEYAKKINNGNPLWLNFKNTNTNGWRSSDSRNIAGTGYLSKKFIDPNIRFSASGTRSHTPSRRPFIRMAELYLNLAECYAALDDTPNAIENLNVIRKRAGVRDLETADLTDMNITEWVRNERFIELYEEGHRYYDLRRWAIAPQMLKAGLRYGLNGLALNPNFEEFNTPTQIDQPFKWDDRLYLLPVWSRSDMDELYSNPQMVQAPGY